METWQKISVLIQVELARGVLPYQQRMAVEARQAIERMQRLLESYIVCMIADKNGHTTKAALDFSRSLLAKAWEGHPAQLCQVPDIGPANMKKLVDKQVTTVLELADLGAVNIERFLSKNPPAAMKLADSLRAFPRLILDGHVAKARKKPRGNGKDDPRTEVKAVARVKFGCANEDGLPRWRNKVPFVTFLATTEEGLLLHIWRGKLQEQEHEVSFAVPPLDADTVQCHYTCDDIVGTMQSLQLPCIDVPREELAGRYPAGSSTQTLGTTNSNVSILRESKEPQPAKRRKLLNYSTHPITVGDTVIDCIDLSAVDDMAGGQVQPPTNTDKRLQDPMSAASYENHRDSFAFQTVSARQLRHCGGGGTQQDPLTLEDSGSDDYDDTFDTSIFDDIELPAIKESPKRKPSDPRRKPSDAGPANAKPPKRKPSKVAAALAPPVFNMHHIDTGLDSDVVPETRCSGLQPAVDGNDDMESVVDVIIPKGVVSGPLGLDAPLARRDSMGQRARAEATRKHDEEIRPAAVDDAPPPCNGDSMSEDRIEEEGGVTDAPEKDVEHPKEAAKGAPKESPEPSWVSMSSSSIVDFLRGHVRFV